MEPNKSTKTSEVSSPSVYWEAPTSNVLTLKYIAIGSLILILGFAGGMYYSRNLSEAQIPQCIKTTPIPSQTISPTTKSDELEGWKTYVGAGFTFKHPSTYSTQNLADGRVLINNDIILSSKNSSYKDCKGDCPAYEKIETVLLSDGVQIIKIAGYQGGIGGNIPQSFIEYEIPTNAEVNTDKYITITLWELPQNIPYQDMIKQYPIDRVPQNIPSEKERELDQILSTFEFINK
ncbi:MAG: hypothetical protein Q8P72_02290 [Candidatus Roizmanbacteria bacterium]|nr:hypothetical protein [Candidatus Roizmanbacteria bacterium]